MTTDGLYKRLVRRELNSSRSLIAIVLAVLLIVKLGWIAAESVLAALGQPALLVAPRDLVRAVLDAASAPAGAIVAIAAVVAIIGLVLVIVALTPGRRGRHEAGVDRFATVVDDRVIAQRLAHSASVAGEVPTEDVSVSVGRTSADVQVTRVAGTTVDTGSIQRSVDEELASFAHTPALRAKVRISEKGAAKR